MNDMFREGGPLAQFDAAMKDITDVRGLDYGPPEEAFDKISTMKTLVHECKNPAVRHALEMICVKLVRLCNSYDHLDSVIDIAGYARTIAMILEEEEKKDD
jgi:hypothetical protein|tara:strand:- start:2656 stop:2958 length:303 start_codon:yes stop_codon:yes gene_type:complete